MKIEFVVIRARRIDCVYVYWEQMTFPADVAKKPKIKIRKRDAIISAECFCMQGLRREMLLEYGLIECTDRWNVDTEVSIDLGEEIERLVRFHGASLLVVASDRTRTACLAFLQTV